MRQAQKKKEKDISLKVRSLIKSDKEAIQDHIARTGQILPEVSEDENDTIETDSGLELDEFIESEPEEEKKQSTKSGKKKRRFTRNKKQKRQNNSLSSNEDRKTEPENDKTEDEADREDFLGSLDKRTEHIVNERIRKQQPNRLKPKENSLRSDIGFISVIRNMAMAEIKNMVVFISIINDNFICGHDPG